MTYQPRPGFNGKARIELDISSSDDLLAKSGRSGPPEMHACNYPCGPDCVHNNTCTPIGVFFGTNRERREHVDRIDSAPTAAAT